MLALGMLTLDASIFYYLYLLAWLGFIEAFKYYMALNFFRRRCHMASAKLNLVDKRDGQIGFSILEYKDGLIIVYQGNAAIYKEASSTIQDK